MPNEPRQHHYLPKFYLAGFTQTDTVDGKLFQVDLKAGKLFETSPATTGQERDLYRIDGEPPQGWNHLSIEQSFSVNEDIFANDLRRILQTRTMPRSGPAFARLLCFLATQYFRTPALREHYKLLEQLMFKHLATDHFSEAALVRRSAEQFNRMPTQEEVMLNRTALEYLKTDKIKLKVPDNAWLNFLIKGVDQVKLRLANRKWNLLIAKDDAQNFIASDVAVAWSIRHPTEMPTCMFPVIDTPRTWIIFPLSQRIVLTGSYEGNHPQGRADDQLVALINNILISSSVRFVYSATKNIVWRSGKNIHGTIEMINEIMVPRTYVPSWRIA